MTTTFAIPDWLDQTASIDTAAADPAARLDWLQIPAKPAVYLLLHEAPVLLATVGNLRAALQRRLADTPPDHKSRRVPYGRLCTTLRYRIVHSPFAANWHYARAARALFPQTYRDMISWRPACFLSINPREPFPRFRRTDELTDPAALYLGPIAERRAADQLIQTLEDLFDLCRHYPVLLQAPHGKACAYKEMGKCPAPCDGSVPMDRYRAQIASALRYLTHEEHDAPRSGYHAFRRELEEAMKAAAARLEFERAGKIKARLDRAAFLEQNVFARMDTLDRFAYLALQPGQGKPWIEPFFIHGGTIEPGAPVKRKELPADAWYRRACELARQPVQLPLDRQAVEQIGLVAHHLFRGEEDAGLYLPLHSLTGPEVIQQAANALLDRNRKNPPKPMAEQSSDRPTPPSVPPSTPAAPDLAASAILASQPAPDAAAAPAATEE